MIIYIITTDLSACRVFSKNLDSGFKLLKAARKYLSTHVIWACDENQIDTCGGFSDGKVKSDIYEAREFLPDARTNKTMRACIEQLGGYQTITV